MDNNRFLNEPQSGPEQSAALLCLDRKTHKVVLQRCFPLWFSSSRPKRGKRDSSSPPGAVGTRGAAGGGVGMWVHVLCSPMSERLCDTRISWRASDHREERGRGGKKKEKEEEEGGEGGK